MKRIKRSRFRSLARANLKKYIHTLDRTRVTQEQARAQKGVLVRLSLAS
jgi:hypothetical protein